MNHADFLCEIDNNGEHLAGYSIVNRGIWWNVFRDRDNGSCEPCVTMCFTTTGMKFGSSPHTVVISYRLDRDGEDSFIGWCGDAFFEGHMKASESTSRITDACVLASRLAPDHDAVQLRAKLESGLGKGGAKSGGCNFWAKRTAGGCKHYKYALSEIKEADLSRLREEYAQVMKPVAAPSAITPAGAYAALRCSAFAHPVLLFGPPGSGKSHAARTYADDAEVTYIEAGLHEGTESIDLLGSMGPFKGGWVWRDGPLAEAFRKAGKGEKVVLLLDELMRMRSSHRSTLLSAFGEFRGTYTLRTGRILSEEDGVGQEETLRCSTNNLFLIATTNIGEQYALDAMDGALKSRFKLVHVPTTNSTLETAIEADLDAKRWPPHEAKVAKSRLMALYKQSNTSMRSGALQASLDVRAIKRMVATAPDANALVETANSECMQCVGLSSEGEPIKEHLDHYTAMVKAIFG